MCFNMLAEYIYIWMAQTWSILDQNWPNMAGLSTLQSGPKGPKRDQNGQPKSFWTFGTLLGPSGPFWTISNKNWYFALKHLCRTLFCPFGAKKSFFSKMVHACNHVIRESVSNSLLTTKNLSFLCDEQSCTIVNKQEYKDKNRTRKAQVRKAVAMVRSCFHNTKRSNLGGVNKHRTSASFHMLYYILY